MISASDKWNALAEFGNRFGLLVFVETGGYHGFTVDNLKDKFRFLITIEIGDVLYREIYDRGIPNVLPLHGDSAVLLPKVVKLLNEPALFWLDAHFSGMDTAGDGVQIPIDAELRSILSGQERRHVVCVDDIGARELEEEKIQGIVSEFAGWEMRIQNGMAVIAAEGRLSA